MKYHFIPVSENRKTGPIPVVYSERETCPDTCPHYRSDCYAEDFFTRMSWDKVPIRGFEIEELVSTIQALPDGQFWRFNIAGDLPGENTKLDKKTLSDIVRANNKKMGFTYTHKLDTRYFSVYRKSIKKGFVINLSADDAKQADTLADSGLPVVCIVPANTPEKTYTPSGRTIAICPAQTRDTNCNDCRLCARPDRKVIVGFRAHGKRQKLTESKIKFFPKVKP